MTNPRKGPRPETEQRDAEYRQFFLDHAEANQSELAEKIGWTQKMVQRFYERNPDIPRNHRGGGFGPRNGSWKGGRTIDKNGYILLRVKGHPHPNHQGYVREHRLVMEKMIGRYLEPHEVVHHKNGKKGDNRPENLELLESNAQNLRYAWEGEHHSIETRRKMSQSAKALWNRRLGGTPAANPTPSRVDVPR
jgi:hypothetical protein